MHVHSHVHERLIECRAKIIWLHQTRILFFFVLMWCCARNTTVRRLSVFAESPYKNAASICLRTPKGGKWGLRSSGMERRRRATRICRFLHAGKESTADGSDKEKPIIFANPATVTSKQDAYSKLPRLYVGPLPTRPILLQRIDDIGTSEANVQGPVCHADAILNLSDDQSHYLTTVLRLGRKKASTQLRVFDGQTEWLAQVLFANSEGRSSRKRFGGTTIQCQKLLRTTNAPIEKYPDDNMNSIEVRQQQHKQPIASSVWLCVAPFKKKDRWRWMIEKTVELGVNGYVFIDTEFGEESSEKNNFFLKMQSYVVEAAEQCERMDLPQFVTFASEPNNDQNNCVPDNASADVLRVALKDFLGLWSLHDKLNVHLLACRERSNSMPVWLALDEIFSGESKQDDSSVTETQANKQMVVAFLIGPEGGWSPLEEEYMNALEMRYPEKFNNVSLGPTILRAETAAMTAIAAYTLLRDANN